MGRREIVLSLTSKMKVLSQVMEKLGLIHNYQRLRNFTRNQADTVKHPAVITVPDTPRKRTEESLPMALFTFIATSCLIPGQ